VPINLTVPAKRVDDLVAYLKQFDASGKKAQ
jgi:hypothetical protein